jgi:hypothetical protein
MMNTVMNISYLNSERYEALSNNQSLNLVRSFKIMRNRYCVIIEE